MYVYVCVLSSQQQGMSNDYIILDHNISQHSLVPRPEEEEEEKGPGFSRSRMRLIAVEFHRLRIWLIYFRTLVTPY